MCIVIRSLATGECMVIKSNAPFPPDYEQVYGPDTCENCNKWVKNNCRNNRC